MRPRLAGASLYTIACAAATRSLSRSATASRRKSRCAIARSLVAARYRWPSSSVSSAPRRVTRPWASCTSVARRAHRARRSSTNRSTEIGMARTYHRSVAVSLGRLEVETADHVVLRYDLAGVGTRGSAALVDGLLAFL